ncbi:MAG: cyclopropane-fatty-acyl-phospholipid synthase [Solirubrobacteraceae bacterium]|nr:cyclopropane-fatty-acyl-phospholipid synthase [Solirubrobacteraceae bacterium]
MLRYTLLDTALERGLLSDTVLRIGSRVGVHTRIRKEARGGVVGQEERLRALVERMSTGPIAEETDAANEQHYELPAEFFGLFLGPRRKYSGCLWGDGVTDLRGAEEAMLALTCQRAGIADGMDILDLGCGWGSLSLWMAEKYPHARILGVSNSNGQREWIEAEAARRGLSNLEIRTQDINGFDPGRVFDRAVSLEMFEHMRNWAELLRRISTWLKPDGKLFVHVFSQKRLPYLFQGTWAAERFFTAGLMPSHELMGFFQRDMVLEERWVVPGTHYAKTLRAWLANLDGNRREAIRILGRHHTPTETRRLFATWRLFLISTDEIWGWRGGDEWLVSHYLLAPRG